jgi:NitT/TauT family transport system permease protein
MQVIDPVLFPSPQASAKAIWAGIFQGNLLSDVRVTVTRTLLSFIIATLICVPFGLILGSSIKLYRSLEFVIDFFRSTPASALFPLFLVILGVGESTKIAVAAFGAGLLILFNTAYGVMNARKVRQAAAVVMGASKTRVLVGVTLLESLPQTFIGMRSGVSFALVIVIVAEMFIGSTDGLGQRVINAQMIFNMPEMYATIFSAGVLGYGLNLFFILIERHFVHWGGK